MSRQHTFYAKPPLDSPRLRVRGLGIRDRALPGTIDRPHGTGDFLLLCAHDPAEIGPDHGPLASGEVVLWEPGQRQCYRSRAGLRHSWLHCDGSLVRSQVRHSGLPTAQAMAPGSGRCVILALNALLREMQSPYPNEDIAAAILQALMLALARNHRGNRGSGLPEPYAAIVREIDAGAAQRLHLPGLAARAGVSVQHFGRTFRALVGESPIAYQQRLRLQHAGWLLHDVERPVGKIAAEVGYRDIFQFSRAFTRHFGCSPRAWRKRPPQPPVADSRDLARWGEPLVVEHFADDSWRGRWLEMARDTWRREGGRIITSAVGGSVLIHPRRFEAPCAIEYDAEIMPGSPPCDLSCVWWEGDDLAGNVGRLFGYQHPGYMVQIGAHDNQYSVIHRNPGHERVAFSLRRPNPGRVHAVRVEFEHDAVRAYVDGDLWLEHRDLFPVASGYLALYGYYPGKAFANVRIWSKGVPERISVLAIGDAAYMRGNWREAAGEWRKVVDSHPGTILAEDARLRAGLALWRAHDREAAEVSWSGLAGERGAIAATMRLQGMWDDGDLAEFARAFAGLWREHPGLHNRLGALWSSCVSISESRPPLIAEPLFTALIALRERVFPEDPATNFAAGSLLIRCGRATEVVVAKTRPLPMGEALNSLGRHREKLALPELRPFDHMTGHLAMGMIDASLSGCHPLDLGFILAKAGRIAEARVRGESAVVNVLCGDPAAALDKAPDTPATVWDDVLVDAARIQLGDVATVAARPASSDGWIAQTLLRREDGPADAWRGSPAQHRQACWMRALEDHGSPDLALSAAIAAGEIDHSLWSGWFIPWFALPMISGRWAGRAGKAALARRVEEAADTLALRAYFLARLIAGSCTRGEFLEQPIRSEAPAWYAIGSAMKAELACNTGSARAAWTDYRSLPVQNRLLERFTVDPLIERFAAWRLRTLGEARE
jgi:AraC-like DNA-binding protein